MSLSETLETFQTPVTPPVTSGRIDLEIDLIGVAHPLPGTSGTPGIDLTEVTEDVAASKVATREMNVATVATRRGDTETEITQKGRKFCRKHTADFLFKTYNLLIISQYISQSSHDKLQFNSQWKVMCWVSASPFSCPQAQRQTREVGFMHGGRSPKVRR